MISNSKAWDYLRPHLGLDSWSFGDFFDPADLDRLHAVIVTASSYQMEAHIERHEFFDIAIRNREALRVWAAQEAVVTNAFSQILLQTCAQIRNVHLRAAFMPVIAGEHHVVRKGIAEHSHPWLLRRLCLSLELEPEKIKPLPFTVTFIEVLSKSTRNTLIALGALGVGNERMLPPEYTAVKKCFEVAWPDSDYQGFLDANIAEDETHTQIIEVVASGLIKNDEDAQDFLLGAKLGVDARVAYYNQLVDYIERN